MYMKWEEFKKLVDKKLKGKNPIIEYMDFSYPDEDLSHLKLNVYNDKDGLSIYN